METISLLNVLVVRILRPTSVRAFVTGLPEICLLLLLLVKLERNDVIAGLAKALVYMYIYMIYIYTYI